MTKIEKIIDAVVIDIEGSETVIKRNDDPQHSVVKRQNDRELSVDGVIEMARAAMNNPEVRAAMAERIKQTESEFSKFEKATRPDFEFMNRYYGV